MINELYKLSGAMNDAHIRAASWHRKYKPLPNITAKFPCCRISISGGRVLEISPVEKELGALLRKYGTNQGTYPGMNLAPLYRITDAAVKKAILELLPEDLEPVRLLEIRSWCTADNWCAKFRSKYKISMKGVPAELSALVSEFEPLQILAEESSLFLDPAVLHRELEESAFAMLSERRDVSTALCVLFHIGNPDESAEDDFGSISAIFETPRLIEMGIPAVSEKFTIDLNEALLSADAAETSGAEASDIDAFGVPFRPVNEPMPEVKLAGGFDVRLRTMFREQRCQMRYGRIESAGYPISSGIRKVLQSSLAWLGSAEQRGKTWINIDKSEILFAYPSRLPEAPASYVNSFCPAGNGGESASPAGSEGLFIERARSLVSELLQGKDAGTDPNADHLQIFILKKLDRARTKIVYTRQTDARELEKRSEEWVAGCENLPRFPFGRPRAIFPLSAADVLNRFWKQNGERSAARFRPVPRHHGIELLLEPGMPVSADLHILSEQSAALGPYIGNRLARGDVPDRALVDNVRDMLALAGMLLRRAGARREIYMKDLPYLFGQLLKVSDELHALYCAVMRNGDLPTQLAGSGLYPFAAEAPVRALNLLGSRMNPYIAWAKSYRTRNVLSPKKESWRAGWLLSLYEGIATELHEVWPPEMRFGDAERAQLFIGYLAAFPKRERRPEQAPGGSVEGEQEALKGETNHAH